MSCPRVAAARASCRLCRNAGMVAVVAVACPELPPDDDVPRRWTRLLPAWRCPGTLPWRWGRVPACFVQAPRRWWPGWSANYAPEDRFCRSRPARICGRVDLELIRVGTVGLCGRCRAHDWPNLARAVAENVCGHRQGRPRRRSVLRFRAPPGPACGRCGRVGPSPAEPADTSPTSAIAASVRRWRPAGAVGEHKPCFFVADGRPICPACSPRATSACAHCAKPRPPLPVGPKVQCASRAIGPLCLGGEPARDAGTGVA